MSRGVVLLVGLAGLGLILACLSAATSKVFDPDVHWLAAAGRWFLASGHVPAQNHFSYTAPDHAWLMHEWLLSPLYAWLLGALGDSGLPLLALVSALSMAAVQLHLSLGRGAHTLASLLVALTTVGVFAVMMASPRPTVVARLLPVGMLLLATTERFGWRHVIGATLLEAIWANAHGSFPLGFAILVVGALSADHDRRLRWVATGTATLATLLNPAGWRLHVLVLDYLTGRDETLRLVHQHVREFSPAYVLLDDPWPFFELGGLALVCVISLSALIRRRHLARAGLALVLCLMGAFQARHIMLAILLGAPLLLPEVASLLGTRGERLALPSRRAVAGLVLLPALGLSVTAWALQRAEIAPRAWVADSLGGVAFAQLARRIPPGASVYTHFGVGGRLIWLGAGRDVRVFYDSRNDCYPPEVVRDAFTLAEPDVDAALALDLLERRGTRYALIGPFGGLGAILEHSDQWRTVGTEGSWRLFARGSVRFIDRLSAGAE